MKYNQEISNFIHTRAIQFHWLGNLTSGKETRYELLLVLAEADENKALIAEMTELS